MKLENLSVRMRVWFAPKTIPYEYIVIGIIDLGQTKKVILQPVDSGKTITIKGSTDRMNAWGWQADFAFATTREEWFSLAAAEMIRWEEGSVEGTSFPLYQNEISND